MINCCRDALMDVDTRWGSSAPCHAERREESWSPAEACVATAAPSRRSAWPAWVFPLSWLTFISASLQQTHDLRQRQQFGRAFGNGEGMLELRGARAICRADRPAVGHDSGLVAASVYHWFHSEDHAGLEPQASMRATEVRHLRVFVQRMTNAMSDKLAYRGEAVGFGIVLNGRADVTKSLPGACLFNTQFHAALRHVHQMLRFGVKVADREGDAGVTNPAFVEDADVDADDISLFEQLLGTGNAVTDDIIDRDTDRRREWRNSWHAVASRTRSIALVDRFRTLTANEIFRDFVEFSG